MLRHLAEMLASDAFMPHGMCFLWRPELLWLHAVSDGLTALAYYSIPFALLYFVLKREDLAFPSVFLLFGAFILACGTTHVMSIWTLWRPDYWIDGGIKLFTAVVSLLTAGFVWRIMPEALALPSRGQLEQANRALERQIEERQRAEQAVLRLNFQLEQRVRDRTAELEATNERLRAALREKDVLLREVHHRVKNNLQVVSGLLTLQARHAAPALMVHFQESLDRIRAMGRVHERLYRSDDVGTLDAAAFIRDICEDLSHVYGAARERVECRVEVPRPVPIDLELATPLALIANEVIANAFKHGFPDERQGEIVVALDETETATRLEIRDDGIGLPDGRSPEPSRSMGLRLVQLLARQIGATTALTGEAGTRFVLTLPHPARG
jgi:two-component sensor histidine kinase